jgi:CPA2 family monovalent cation:H+ antiporter-2
VDQFHIIRDLLIAYLASGLVIYLFQKVGQSAIVGFLVTGVLAGPEGLGLIADAETVHVLAEIGVMLLLFSIGLEFSPRKLSGLQRVVLLTGPLQILITVSAVLVTATVIGIPLAQGIVIGFFTAMSSTALVVKVLLERGELDSIHGRVCLGILIAQDLAVVPMIVLITHLDDQSSPWLNLFFEITLAFLLLGLVFLGARRIFPGIVRHVIGLRSKELFVISVILSFLGTAWLTSFLGFSLALGGFLAGLILSASEYSQQIFSEIRPLRDILNSLFFFSIGMLVSPVYVIENLPVLLGVVSLFVIGKAVITTAVGLLTGISAATAVVAGLSLAQVGEFSFILLEEASRLGLITSHWYQILISSAVVTMLFTPLMIAGSRRIAVSRLALRIDLPSKRRQSFPELGDKTATLRDHVIICGYGVSGVNVARILKANQIRYLILDLNPKVVNDGKKDGEPIFFGDINDSSILEHAGIAAARVITLAISDPYSAKRVVRIARTLNPEILILVRTKRVLEIDELYDAGADEVITEEFEASIEMMTRILRIFNFPRDLISSEVKRIREDRYGIFRESKATVPRLRLSSTLDIFTETAMLPGDSTLVGRMILETQLRQKTGALILGIIRGGLSINSPGPRERLQEGDSLILIGTKPQLRAAMELIRAIK